VPVPSAKVQVALSELRSVCFVRWWSDESSSGFGVAEAVGGSSGSVAGVFAAVLWWSGKLFAVCRCLFCFFLFLCFFFRFLFTGITVGGGLFWILSC